MLMRTMAALVGFAFLSGSTGLADQGGDTILDATVIDALPYHATGTTLGYTNDYDEVCPYGGSTSPDVVYAFMPAEDMTVRITLCNDGTDYDTKLYVYENQYTPGAPYACSDDYCGAVSELSELLLTADLTYYVVIDGYGGEAGDYELDFVELVPEECPADALYGQPLLGPDSAVSSDREVGQYLADNFTLAEPASVCALRFWGIENYHDGMTWHVCEEPEPVFDVTIYAAGVDMPDYATVVCTAAGVPAERVTTETGYLGSPVYRYELTLTDCCPLAAETEYWIEIIGDGAQSSCWFLWLNETAEDVGDDRAYWNGAIPPVKLFDMSMCLSPGASCPTTPGDVSGDGIVNNFDIKPFVYAITHTEEEFAQVYPEGHYWCADVSDDGIVNNFDIKPFVNLLLGSQP